jgi:DAK2 domain fusion protein YloV
MVSQVYDGQFFKASLQVSQALLEEHREELNELNVFPVPDGDTGTNMLFTIKGAVEGVIDSLEDSAGKVAALAARSALLSARGNSGVLFSQILMGIARGLDGKIRFSPSEFAQALTLGAEKAYNTLVNPVEGTILTVMREAANAAHRAAQQGANLARMMDEVVLCAQAAIERTPELLPILKEAGVVDAGGQGLYYVLEAMRSCAREEGVASGRSVAQQPVTPLVKARQEAYGYEIQLIIRGQDLPFDEARHTVGEMGESVLVVGSGSLIRVHVHTPRPDRVLAYALDIGQVEDVAVENLDEQVRSVVSGRRQGPSPH